MTDPRGAPRKYAPTKCPECGEKMGLTYLSRHIQKKHRDAEGRQA